jgi:hypothetical protein
MGNYKKNKDRKNKDRKNKGYRESKGYRKNKDRRSCRVQNVAEHYHSLAKCLTGLVLELERLRRDKRDAIPVMIPPSFATVERYKTHLEQSIDNLVDQMGSELSQKHHFQPPRTSPHRRIVQKKRDGSFETVYDVLYFVHDLLKRIKDFLQDHKKGDDVKGLPDDVQMLRAKSYVDMIHFYAIDIKVGLEASLPKEEYDPTDPSYCPGTPTYD